MFQNPDTIQCLKKDLNLLFGPIKQEKLGSREMDVWVEDEPPTTAVVSGPSTNQSIPSTVAFTFASVSGGGSGTPISRSVCRLVQLSTAVAQQQAATPTPQLSLPGSSIRPASGPPPPTVLLSYTMQSSAQISAYSMPWHRLPGK